MRMLLKHCGDCYRFLGVAFEPRRDGSLYIRFDRKGETEGAVTYDPETGWVEKLAGQEKGFRIHYHTSGRVNYHGLSGGPHFNDPLFSVTTVQHLITISVPQIDRLDPYEGKAGDNLVSELPGEVEGRVTLTLLIAPWNHDFGDLHPLATVTYEGLFSLGLVPDTLPCPIPKGLEQHFHYIKARKGLYDRQSLSKEEALLHFHQKLQNTRDLIIYSPNPEGVYRVIFAVPKRIPPEAVIEFSDDELHVEMIEKTTTSLRFKVKDQHDNTVKEPKAIRSVELQAEL